MFNKNKCKHEWNIIETYKFENELQRLFEIESHVDIDYDVAETLARRGIITVCQCKHCGVVDHITTVFE